MNMSTTITDETNSIKEDLTDALLECIRAREITAIKRLIKIGADVNHDDGKPLAAAILANNARIIKILRKNGCKMRINETIKNQFYSCKTNCPLKFAIYLGKEYCIDYFIDINIDPTIKDDYGFNTLEFATICYLKEEEDKSPSLLESFYGRNIPYYNPLLKVISDYYFKYVMNERKLA